MLLSYLVSLLFGDCYPYISLHSNVYSLVDNNTWKCKSCEEWGRPRSIHHVSNIQCTGRGMVHCICNGVFGLAVKHSTQPIGQ